jgi:hypothetical protein
MPRIDDAYLILWRYLPDISFFTTNILIYETTDDPDDHGIQTRIVSRVLRRVGQLLYFSITSIWLTTINTQLTGVKPTSDPTKLFLLM